MNGRISFWTPYWTGLVGRLWGPINYPSVLLLFLGGKDQGRDRLWGLCRSGPERKFWSLMICPWVMRLPISFGVIISQGLCRFRRLYRTGIKGIFGRKFWRMLVLPCFNGSTAQGRNKLWGLYRSGLTETFWRPLVLMVWPSSLISGGGKFSRQFSRMLILLMCFNDVTAQGRGVGWRTHREVATRQGSVRGYQHTPPAHYAYLGIPYAGPPAGEDRYKSPLPPPQWDGIFEATHRVKCIQPSGEGDENCLVLNVFTPERARQRPVLVHVHDGGFQEGWGTYQPPERLMQDFIVVTFNYRVGVLGFLCLGAEQAPGNAGLKDQVAALYWVHRNIESFGGNPNNITLYGTGAGAVSIQLLLLSGLAKGLFHQVILESGSVLSPAYMAYDPYETALSEAIFLGYNDEGSREELIEFYMALTVDDIVNISSSFLPCVESSFFYAHSLIASDPISVLRQGFFDKVPLLAVYTEAEEITLIEDNPQRCSAVPEYFDDLLPNNLDFGSEDIKYRMAEFIKQFYFDEKDLTVNNIMESYVDYINDVFMEYPVVKFAVMYAVKSAAPVYLMKFAFSVDTESYGARQGDVFKYIFTKIDQLESDEEAVVQRLLSLWKNFITIGDPTPLSTPLVPVIWQSLNPEGKFQELDIHSVSCLQFNRTLVMGTPPAGQRLNFWDRIYNKFYRLHTYDGP